VNPINIVAGVYTDPFTGIAYAYDLIPVQLTLNERCRGRLVLLKVSGSPQASDPDRECGGCSASPFGIGGIYYVEPPTEFVTYDTLRIWDVFNFTADAHPMQLPPL